MGVGKSIGGRPQDGNLTGALRVKKLELKLRSAGMPEELVMEMVRQEWIQVGLEIRESLKRSRCGTGWSTTHI